MKLIIDYKLIIFYIKFPYYTFLQTFNVDNN